VAAKQQDDPGTGEGDPAGGTDDQRLAKLEEKVDSQGSALERIEAAVGKLAGGGDTPPATAVTSGTQPPAADPAVMAEQMRQAVRDVQAEADAEAGKAARLRTGPPPETTPREVMVKGKDRLQALVFGKDPK